MPWTTTNRVAAWFICLSLLAELPGIYRYKRLIAEHYYRRRGNPVYFPVFVRMWFACARYTNQIRMNQLWFSHGGGLLELRPRRKTGKIVLCLGGIGSPSFSSLYLPRLLAYIQGRYDGASRVFAYYPPEARLGCGYTVAPMSVNVDMPDLAARCLDRVQSAVRGRQVDSADISIVGHSYGSILATYIRRAHPVAPDSDCFTELLEPVLYRGTIQQQQDFLYGRSSRSRWRARKRLGVVRTVRRWVLGYLMRDVHLLYGVTGLADPIDGDPVKHAGCMGRLSLTAGEHDEFCGEFVGHYDDMTCRPNTCHGDLLLHL